MQLIHNGRKALLLAIVSLFGSACNNMNMQPLMDVASIYAQQQGYIAPTTGESEAAMRQALNKGVLTAVNTLGQQDGFAASSLRIPLPENIQSAARIARQAGLGRYVDDFELSMNRAAEEAVPVAADVFRQAIAQMTVQDVVSILTGPDDAATQYFTRVSGQQLQSRFMPIVTQATSRVGVTDRYKTMATQVNQYGALLGLGMPLEQNLDQYIAQRASDALFVKMAEQEKMIREQPVERTSALLQKVFGYYSRQSTSTQ